MSETRIELTQPGIFQFIMDMMAKINAEGGRERFSTIDGQLLWVDVFLRGEEQHAQRVPLTIFDDASDGKGYEYITAKVESNIREAIAQIYAVCPDGAPPS
jgi:hypothetical protein